MGPHPAVAAIRLAVRRVLHDVLQDVTDSAPAEDVHHAGVPSGGVPHADAPHAGVPRGGVIGMRQPLGAAPSRTERPLVLAACSGGADSMALASALAFEAGKVGVRAGARHRRPRAAVRLRPPAPSTSSPSCASSVLIRPRRSRSPWAARAVLRPPPGTPATRRWRARRPRSARSPYCSATPATTRRKRCCSGSPADPAPAPCPAWPRSPGPAGATGGPSCCSTATPPARRAWSRASTYGRTRTTPTPPTPAPGSARGAAGAGEVAGPGRGRLAGPYRPALPGRRRRAGPVGRDGPARGGSRRRPRGRAGGAPGCARCRPPYGAGCCARRRSRRARPAGSLFARHVEEVDRLVTGWRGQGPLNLPGGIEARQVGWQTGLPARQRSRMTDRRSEPAGLAGSSAGERQGHGRRP